MKSKINSKKLVLNKKTVSHLTEGNMSHVNGGVAPLTTVCNTFPDPDSTCATAFTNCQATCPGDYDCYQTVTCKCPAGGSVKICLAVAVDTQETDLC